MSCHSNRAIDILRKGNSNQVIHYICVVKLETCAMRAIIVAMDLARVVTRQCERIIEIYSVLILPLVALLYRSTQIALCVKGP